MTTPDQDSREFPADILQRISTDFPAQPAGLIESLLAGYRGPECDRVQRCIVHLAQGDSKRLAHFIAVATGDYRDVIYWAEYDTVDQRIHDFNQPFHVR